MAVCKGCGAEVVWAKTTSGKAMPLDAKAERRFILRDENAALVETYTSHFATCPKASEFRKGKNDG